jgi:hypothetical protein
MAVHECDIVRGKSVCIRKFEVERRRGKKSFRSLIKTKSDKITCVMSHGTLSRALDEEYF